MNNNRFMEMATKVTADHINRRNSENGLRDIDEIKPDDLYVVWFSKTLQNWKTLVSSDKETGRYYEITYNGNKKEVYLDDYRKTNNVCIQEDGIITRTFD